MEKPFLLFKLFFTEHEGESGFWSPVFDPIPVFHTVIMALILVGVVLAFRRQLKNMSGEVVPTDKVSVLNIFDVLISAVVSFEKELFGDEWKKYLPIPLAIFVIILFGNLLGLIPYFEPTNSNVNNTVAMAICVFCLTHYYGIKIHGFGYVKQFLGPVWWLSPLMLPLEIISHLARVLSLSIRLFGNLFADHMVVTIFLGLAPFVIPSAFMGLGLLVCLIQAFIFSMLSAVYFYLAISHEH